MNAKCARTACDCPHDNCKHSQDGRLYCEWCAIKINRANPEVPNLVRIPRLEAAKRMIREAEKLGGFRKDLYRSFSNGMRFLVPATDTHGFLVTDSDGVIVAECDELNEAILCAAAPGLLESLEPNREPSTEEFLDWVADRLTLVHGDNQNADYVHALRRKANKIGAAIKEAAPL